MVIYLLMFPITVGRNTEKKRNDNEKEIEAQRRIYSRFETNIFLEYRQSARHAFIKKISLTVLLRRARLMSNQNQLKFKNGP